MTDETSVKSYFLSLQDNLCAAIESLDATTPFQTDCWEYPGGGGGKSRILAEGKVIERGGVNFADVQGQTLPQAATKKRADLVGAAFEARGVSAVFHPQNPYAPTAHLNVRFLKTTKKDGSSSWWFGGGYDLTPYYGFEEDCQHWHQVAKEACEPFGADLYPRFKQWADDYFYLPHRQEPRGIGGLFFDDVNEMGFETSFAFIQSVGNSFLKAYLPIIEKRSTTSFGERERDFQLYRRGRYVEFNLLYDRGTLFGLQSGGRTESILMSLPPLVKWRYNWSPEKNSSEALLYSAFLQKRNWVD